MLNFQNVDWGQAVAVFITGLLVVFTALVVLVLVFWAFGKIMETMGKAPKTPKSPKEKKEPKKEAPKQVKVIADAGLSDEVVAAITGAINAILAEEGNNSSFVIKSIKRTRKAIGGWRKAGIIENIREF